MFLERCPCGAGTGYQQFMAALCVVSDSAVSVELRETGFEPSLRKQIARQSKAACKANVAVVDSCLVMFRLEFQWCI